MLFDNIGQKSPLSEKPGHISYHMYDMIRKYVLDLLPHIYVYLRSSRSCASLQGKKITSQPLPPFFTLLAHAENFS